MKTNVFLTLIAVSIVFCSWTTDMRAGLNINSWNIHIGKKTLLSSRKNKMGDTALFDEAAYKLSDTLFAEHYLCGSLGQPATTTLTIKNQQNEIIKEVVNKDYRQWGTAGYIPLSQLIHLSNFKSGQIVSIFLTIDFLEEQDERNPVLLGHLKIK